MINQILKNTMVMAGILFFGLTAQAGQPQIGDNTQLTVRTSLVDKHVVAVTNDGRFFAIVCNRGVLLKSNADLLFPNSEGEIITEFYNSSGSRSIGLPPRAPFIPLEFTAMVQICNHPSGIYTLSITNDGDGKIVNYVGGHTLEADSGHRPRGF